MANAGSMGAIVTAAMKEAAAVDHHRMQPLAGQSAAMAKPVPAGVLLDEIWNSARAAVALAPTIRLRD